VTRFWIFDFRFSISGSKRAKVTSFALGALLFALCSSAQAQQTAKMRTIGWLGARSASAPGRAIFVRELRELGYIEGQNIAIAHRYADNNYVRLPALAEELVRLKVDVLVAAATTEALAAKKVTRAIPIVFSGTGDPVVFGLVDSLARPGGNLTGFTRIGAALAGKRLELLKEAVSGLSRVALLWDAKSRSSAEEWKQSQLAGRELGLQLHSMEVSSADQFEHAFQEAIKARSRALAVLSSPLAASNQKRITDLANKNRLPAIYPDIRWADIGGLISYGADRNEPYRRIALMVDKIFKGAKPADLPVEQPTKFELVINLKTAKQIGLAIPPNVLARANKVIK
jgi:putative ABC transport system substrate-binding protein